MLDEIVYVINGNPDPTKISTSYVERQNLTMRMGMLRFTRLTNAFPKKVENLGAAVALRYMHYNFGRPHSSLGKNRTPAMRRALAPMFGLQTRSPCCSTSPQVLPVH